ncbi:MAG: hypothetical protein EOL97_09425 [Spirochaetia bacterium]|nr:hypothetical protein [Spirochaetia bacterium]
MKIDNKKFLDGVFQDLTEDFKKTSEYSYAKEYLNGEFSFVPHEQPNGKLIFTIAIDKQIIVHSVETSLFMSLFNLFNLAKKTMEKIEEEYKSFVTNELIDYIIANSYYDFPNNGEYYFDLDIDNSDATEIHDLSIDELEDIIEENERGDDNE